MFNGFEFNGFDFNGSLISPAGPRNQGLGQREHGLGQRLGRARPRATGVAGLKGLAGRLRQRPPDCHGHVREEAEGADRDAAPRNLRGEKGAKATRRSQVANRPWIEKQRGRTALPWGKKSVRPPRPLLPSVRVPAPSTFGAMRTKGAVNGD